MLTLLHQYQLHIKIKLWLIRLISHIALLHTLWDAIAHPVRMPDSQSREPSFKSHCGRFEPLTSLITPRCHSLLSCINEYLAMQTVVDM